jgi:hypothetical protein
MQKLIVRLFVAAAIALALRPSAFSQGVTTGSITGFVTSQTGQPVAGATVTVVHVPSGTRAATATRTNGQYDVSGLRIGGPYKITIDAKDFQPGNAENIFVGVDHTETVNLTLTSGAVQLEKFTVTSSRDIGFDPGKMGATTSFTRQEISQVPTIRRDVQDIVNMDTRAGLTINTSTGEFSVSAQGQNSRFNSFLIDGQQSNDPFGLNANGFTSLRSPVPLDALAALTVDLSPYDVTRSGFTGALVNAVTKSGTNEFHGDVYGYYTGKDLRGENPGQGPTDPNKGVKDPLQEHTYGGTFGGPIIKDKLFFFLAYDSYQKTSVPSSPVIFQPNQADLDAILTAANNYGITPGTQLGLADAQQKSYLAKIDWNINQDQRLSVTYRRTDSSAPSFSNGSGYTQLSSNAYQANRKNDNISALLNSNWTPDFRTEFGLSGSKYNGTASLYTPLAPEIYINGVTGTNLVTGAAVANGQIDLGTNYSYQLNSLYTKDYNGHLYGEYTWRDHDFKFGADVDKATYSDVFGQYYAGRYIFTSPTAFAAGTPYYVIYQQALTGGDDTVAAATYGYSYTDVGLLAQDTWKPNQNLTITGGLRFDYPYIPDKPIYLPAFEAAFGIPNNTVPSGNYTLAPRLGFNYQLPTKWPIQVRGGIGLFRGTNPAVWIANSYGTTGQLNTVLKNTSSSTSSTTAPPLGAPYTPFNPDPGYVQTLPPPLIPTPTIAITDPDFKTPVAWKDNLAVDVTLPWLGLVATAEANFIQVEEAIYYKNLNLNPIGTTPDGRVRYATAGLYPNFSKTGVYELTNSDQGGSQAYTVQFTRAMKNHWAFYAGYTHTHATEVQPLTSSVAASNFNNRAVINPNDDVAYNSAYVIPDKFVVSATREFNFFKTKYSATRLSAIFRAQTGHTYSWVFGSGSDVNNDGRTGNDAFYVPTGPNDPKVVWADTTGAQEAAFWSFVGTTNLQKFKGQIVPPNNTYSPWQQTLDLHLEQEIPIHHELRLTLFADCINFANLIDKKYGVDTGIDFATGPTSGYTRGVATATINSAGQYVYTFTSSTLTQMTKYTDLSRWQLQLGAKLEF